MKSPLVLPLKFSLLSSIPVLPIFGFPLLNVVSCLLLVNYTRSTMLRSLPLIKPTTLISPSSTVPVVSLVTGLKKLSPLEVSLPLVLLSVKPPS